MTDALFQEVGLDAAQRGEVLVAGNFAQLAGDSGDGVVDADLLEQAQARGLAGGDHVGEVNAGLAGRRLAIGTGQRVAGGRRGEASRA